MRVLMWEVRARDAVAAEALTAWWRAGVDPVLPDGAVAELYRSRDDRVVALVRGTDEDFAIPDPPDGLVARPPHAWPFETVD